jgi:outer membrane protein OmpA-like peptidoglycan-associated protein
MKKIWLLLILSSPWAFAYGQIILIGHNMINNNPIKNTTVWVNDGSAITQSLNTKVRSDFKLQLGYGKIYKVYFQNPQCPLMHLEIIANNVPKDRYNYMMVHELNVPFADRLDEDIDTTVFKNPFCRIIFNGENKMVDDTAYNNAFAGSVIKKIPVEEPITERKMRELPVIVAGKIYVNGDGKLTVNDRPILLIGKNGQVLKRSTTNRFGAFAFTGVKASEVDKIRLETNDSLAGYTHLTLVTSKNQNLISTKPLNGVCEWTLNQSSLASLVDNNYTTNIGGKLVSSSAKEKKFFSFKTVYLSNKMNTVIKQTRTNKLGTFVFEDVKPDNHYFVGVDKSEIIPGEKIDLLSKEDNYLASLDTVAGGRASMKLNTNYNKTFNDMSIGDNEVKMDIEATIFGDNVNNPIGKLKIILLNDNYEVIDSAITDNFGTFKFKYLPFLKRFYLSAENTDNILDVFKNILIYSSEENLIKIMTHQKGKKFTYNPVSAEVSSLRDIELEDPWLEFIEDKKAPVAINEKKLVESMIPPKGTPKPKLIVENILFENNKYDVTPQAKEILDKIILVMNTNKKLQIEIGAHTDSKGSAAANMTLSQMRAKTVQDYIVKSGIDVKRIVAKGYGETQLINKCSDAQPCSEIEHAQNRRIEFIILGQ